ncbi:unnamed protein product, partial [Meganyctiphanes norvegica]
MRLYNRQKIYKISDFWTMTIGVNGVRCCVIYKALLCTLTQRNADASSYDDIIYCMCGRNNFSDCTLQLKKAGKGIPFPDHSTTRADARCGSSYLAPNGKPGICAGVYGCCSNGGWCGHTDAHCLCSACIDYRENIYLSRRSSL